MILTNRKYPPRMLIKQIRDELVIRENITAIMFKQMLETETIMDHRDLILDRLDIDFKEGV